MSDRVRHIDSRSGVSPYLQIVQQVKQALRLGLLRRATGCPRSRRWWPSWRSTRTPCSRRTASWSTKVWSQPPGVGTFVTRTLADDSLTAHGPLRADLRGWLDRARPPGLTKKHRGAVRTTVRDTPTEGDDMTRRARGRRSGQAVRAPVGAAGLLAGPAGRAVWSGWSGQRRRQDHAAAAGGRPAGPDDGDIEVLGGRPAADAGSWPRSASSPRTPRCTRTSPSPTSCGWARRLNPRWDDALARDRLGRLGLDPASRPASSPAASVRRSPSPWRSRSGPSC